MVTDLGRSVRFYQGDLGLARIGPASDETAELDAAGMTIRLHIRRAEIPEEGSGTAAVGLRVKDLPRASSLLQRKGIPVGRVLRSGARRIALFDDPDGNHLYLYDETTG